MANFGDARPSFPLLRLGGSTERSEAMNEIGFYQTIHTSMPDNYERYFVPAIGGPASKGLLAAARLSPGERVLDVACGTGVVTRAAADAVGSSGAVAGLDINPAMLATARKRAHHSIDWYEASAESMPLPDRSFDVVLCQMGLQFMSNKPAAIAEMHRVLTPGGRALVTVPGPEPDLLSIMREALGRRIGADAAAFARTVFSLHDEAEMRKLFEKAGFGEVEVKAATARLHVPEPRDFLRQYICSTPMMGTFMKTDEATRTAFEQDVTDKWEPFRANGGMNFEVRITTAFGRA
jgi:ubiquinone/menaquinone biosynthesis C-methylase UbiE